MMHFIPKGANEEAAIMKNNGEFQPAQQYRKEGDDVFRDETARDDQTVWLDPSTDYEDDSKRHINEILKMLSLGLVQDLSKVLHLNGKVEYQLAYYHPQNARYERHRDAFPVSDQEDITQRRVTAIVYLNPDWIAGDGGELRIYGKNGEPDQDIQPIATRMVVFLSGVADHAVVAASQDRYALTAWIR
jgi:Rps23 Pro-64 3,4-dihydroxylase Tpa1-like proline 4-hydroxylase